MTEDEAFIRTIVDSPGDDLPRLVYADWLDERGDPRGAYLRAEAEWAKAKQTAGFLLLRLNGLADGLDPVWVARVSRPPVGVCADDVGFMESGPPLDDEQLNRLECELEVVLPAELRAFFLNWNGGVPRANRFPHPLLDRVDCELQPWFSVGASQHCEARLDFAHRALRHRNAQASERHDLAPLCAADLGYYEHISIALRGDARGQVWHDLSEELNGADPPPVVVASSLPEFLSRLTRTPVKSPTTA